METNENEGTTIQNLVDTGKAILREKFIALQDYIKKERKGRKEGWLKERAQINNLNSNLKELNKEQQQQQKQSPKVSRRKEIIKTIVEINEITF